MGLCRTGWGGGQIASRERRVGNRESGEILDQVLYYSGQREIPLRCPNPRPAVGSFGDGYGDVWHGFSVRDDGSLFSALAFYFLVCAKGG
jgi:hypothetical protein